MPPKRHSKQKSEFENHFDLSVVLKTLKAFTPTARELQRPMRESELKELCLRIPCRIEMSRWNPVYDYQKYFLEHKRLQTKCPHARNALIAKAVNRYKDTINFMPTDEEIQEKKQEEWQWRKREHLMCLRLWQHQRHDSKVQAFVWNYLKKLESPDN